MSFESDRNPSPPPEILNIEDLLPDKIGDTAYSKRWTIKALMNIVEACDKPKGTPRKPDQNSDLPDETIDDLNDIVELDPTVEEDACILWDMSASEHVSMFLLESDVCKIFQDVINQTQSPRLLEIVIGILGNMCTFDTVCQKIMEQKHLLYTILCLTGTNDSPSLLQVLRLIFTGLKNKNCENQWFELFKENEFIMNNISYILSNSLNHNVILAAFHVLFAILSGDYHYSQKLSEDSFILSVITAGKLLHKFEDCLGSFFCVFSALCQYTPNIEKFAENWDELKPIFFEYIIELGKGCLFDVETAISVSRYFDSYESLLASGLMEKDSVIADTKYLSSIARIYAAIDKLILHIEKNNKEVEAMQHLEVTDTAMERNLQEVDTWKSLKEIIIDTLKYLQQFIEKDDARKILEDILNCAVI